MKDKNYSEILLSLAEKDILALKGMIDNTEFFHDEVFGFHAQQAVEKLLKSFLSYNEVEFVKTHDLTNLFSVLKSIDNELYKKYNELDDLNDFAVEYRYDLLIDEEKINRKSILSKITELQTEIKNTVNKIK